MPPRAQLRSPLRRSPGRSWDRWGGPGGWGCNSVESTENGPVFGIFDFTAITKKVAPASQWHSDDGDRDEDSEVTHSCVLILFALGVPVLFALGVVLYSWGYYEEGGFDPELDDDAGELAQAVGLFFVFWSLTLPVALLCGWRGCRGCSFTL